MNKIQKGPDLHVYQFSLNECVACQSKEIGFWSTKSFSNTHKTNGETFTIYRCNDCGTGFLNPPPRPELLDQIYAESGHGLTSPISLQEVLERERRFPNSRLDAERMTCHARILDFSNNRRALDVGSGFGFYTKALKEQGYKVVSINPGKYENSVFEELNGHPPLPLVFQDFKYAGKFGVIVMSQVLEHIPEPADIIKKVSQFLEKGGVFACAVPNFRSFSVRIFGTKDNACLWVPEHVNYFTLSGITRLLEKHGLKIIRHYEVTRVRYDLLSRRLRSDGLITLTLDNLVKHSQRPIAALANALGMGIYLNLYAIKA